MSKRLETEGEALVIADAVTDLPYPPAVFGLVPGSWTTASGCVPVADVGFRAVAAVTLTDVALYAGRRFDAPNTVAPTNPDETALDAAGDLVTIAGHPYLTGDGPVTVAPGLDGLIPLGLTAGTEYWLIVDADDVQFATTLAGAITGGAVALDDPRRAELDLATLTGNNMDHVVEAILQGVDGESITLDIVFDGTGAGTLTEGGTAVVLHVEDNVTTNANVNMLLGTSALIRVKTATVTPNYVLQSATDNFAATALALASTYDWTITPAADAQRFHWSLLGSVGTVDLDAQKSATVSIEHRPYVVAYAATATFGGSVETTIQMDPIAEVP